MHTQEFSGVYGLVKSTYKVDHCNLNTNADVKEVTARFHLLSIICKGKVEGYLIISGESQGASDENLV